jgi:hypothetical protein
MFGSGVRMLECFVGFTSFLYSVDLSSESLLAATGAGAISSMELQLFPRVKFWPWLFPSATPQAAYPLLNIEDVINGRFGTLNPVRRGRRSREFEKVSLRRKDDFLLERFKLGQ